MQLQQQQKNLNTYLNNIPYQHKQQLKNDLVRFVKENDSFWIRTNIERNNMDQFFSFIEVVGFVNVGKNMIELRIMMPHNYPLATPQFDLLYDHDSYQIVNQGILVANKTIVSRKNASNQEVLRLNYNSLKNLWNNSSRRNISEAFKQVSREINTPSLLMQRHRGPSLNASFKNISAPNSLKRGVTGKMSEQIMNQLEADIFSIQEKVDKVQSIKMDKQYKESRTDFIQRNAGKLEKALKAEEVQVQKQMRNLRQKHQEMLLSGSVDPILQMTPQDKMKIEALARQEAVKEAQRKMVQCLQKNLSEKKGSFDDHKGMVRQFYEQMFDAQSNYLKACE